MSCQLATSYQSDEKSTAEYAPLHMIGSKIDLDRYLSYHHMVY